MDKTQASSRNASVRAIYEGLIRSGTYSVRFGHPPANRSFFAEIMSPLVADLPMGAAVIEAGCGAGAWLAQLDELLGETSKGVTLSGFDLTPGMVDLARARLGSNAELWVGDVLDDSSYDLHRGGRYDLVFAYDVVQQLPPGSQRGAVDTLLGHLAPGGVLVVFDHDARSWYGRVMSVRKRLTRWGIPLVPPFFLTAQYPHLASIARDLQRQRGLCVEIRMAADRRKRALIVRTGPKPLGR